MSVLETSSSSRLLVNITTLSINAAVSGAYVGLHSEGRFVSVLLAMVWTDITKVTFLWRQGSEGDLFYIVESGEFEVLVSQVWLIKPDVCLSSFVH
jgi:CRP-like cAMP-binding protein